MTTETFPVRKNIRLKDYDYSQVGYYFITICTRNRINWLGKIDVGQKLCSCRLSEIGIITETELFQLENRYSILKIEKHIIMPNHVHAIFALNERREQSPRPTTLMDMICTFKSVTSKAFNKASDTTARILWQSRFHDHIIRNEAEYQNIWQYIDTNPAKWKEDCYYV